MRLVSLTLNGFKSFGDRTVIEIAPGVTALIGPNGSGKSNLLDALKWATGGGRASSYRAGDKRELIFHGADGKRGMGYAEVEVEFEDGNRSLKIVRSLDRDGNGKLKLNGRTARVADVDDALAGSGLGRSGVAVIGQGEVGQVLMADPSKLLAYVAEAAGVSKLSGRRDLTAARLDTARQHLERLSDILLELDAQLERLEREAEAAALHAALSREGLRLRFTVASARRDALRGDIRKLLARQVRLSETIELGRDVLRGHEETQRSLRNGLREAESAFREAQALSERRLAEVRVAEERLSGLGQRRVTLVAQSDGLEVELAQLRSAQPPVAPAGELRPLLAAERAQHEAWSVLVRDLAEAQGRFSERQARFERAQVAEAVRLERAAYRRARCDDLEGQREQLEAAMAALVRAEPEGVDEAASIAAAAQERAVAAERALAAAREVLERSHAEHASAAAEALALARAAERQRSGFEARRGYAQGPRQALTSGLPGVLGSVADLLRVPVELRTAIAGALGRRSEYVVVERGEQARAILDHVKRSGGWVTVLPLDLLAQGRKLSRRWSEVPGAVGPAAELVETDGRFAPMLLQLLGNVLVMEGFDEALALSRSEPKRPRLVTLDGTLLETSGALSGGRPAQRGVILGAGAEVEEADAAAESARSDEHEALLRLDGARATFESKRAEAGIAAEALAAARETEQHLAATAAQQRARADELNARHRSVEADLAALQAEQQGSEGGLDDAAELATNLSDERRRLDTLRDRVEAARSELDGAQRTRLLLESELRGHAAATERFEAQRERVVALGRLEASFGDQLAALDDDLAAAERALAEARAALPSDVDARRKARDATERALEEAETSVRRAGEAQATAAQELEQCRVQLARREAALELALEEMSAFPDGLEVFEQSERAARARLRDVNEELEALGAVNHRARSDYEAARERRDALAADMEQADAAVAELEGALEGLDAETNERYERALDQLQSRFNRHVLALFGPQAQAGIEVERDDGRHQGLRIQLTPPGKRTQALGLLSLGERTMGALAFLFALMSEGDGDGLPVAVLDEVDAPLDEANIRRYCSFLERLATRGTQFVLVTHQKATFEVADVLWGVTTEEGVSRVFSIRKEEGAL